MCGACACLHVCRCVCIGAYIRVCTYIRVCATVCMHPCTRTCVHAHIYMRVPTCACTCTPCSAGTASPQPFQLQPRPPGQVLGAGCWVPRLCSAGCLQPGRQAGSSAGSSQAARRQLAGRQPHGQAARTQPVPTPPTCAGSRVPTTEPPLCRWARVCAHMCVCVHTRVPACARLAALPSPPKCPQLAPAPPKKMPLGPQHLPPAVAVPGPSPARRGARGGRVVIKLICTCKSSSV